MKNKIIILTAIFFALGASWLVYRFAMGNQTATKENITDGIDDLLSESNNFYNDIKLKIETN